MKKIDLLYEATIFNDAVNGNASRTGVFRVAWEILAALDKRDDISVHLYFPVFTPIDVMLYLKENGIKNAKIMVALPPLRRVRTFLRALRNYLKLRLKYKINAELRFNKNFDFAFTASLWAADRLDFIDRDKKFAFGHDVMPLVFPDFYPNQDWITIFNFYDNFFANSEYTKKDFLKYLPRLKDENIIVTPLACDERFKPENSAAIAAARKKYNIPENKKYIFSLCTLEPRKNLIRAVKCFATFIRKNNIDDLVFVLGGAHWDRFISILESEIENLNELKDKILKIGYVDDADQAALYSGALFFVYTSQYEGFGLPPLEAMSCGTPVITSNNSSLPEVVGEAGIMIDYDDDEAHIKAYEDYYFNENLRAENSAKGLEQAKKFSWEKCADIMVSEMKARMKK